MYRIFSKFDEMWKPIKYLTVKVVSDFTVFTPWRIYITWQISTNKNSSRSLIYFKSETSLTVTMLPTLLYLLCFSLKTFEDSKSEYEIFIFRITFWLHLLRIKMSKIPIRFPTMVVAFRMMIRKLKLFTAFPYRCQND